MSYHSQSSLKSSKKVIQASVVDNETPTKLMSPEDDRTFLKESIKHFYNRIIDTDSFNDFENSSIEWIKNTLEHHGMNSEGFLESIRNQPMMFSSLIGFFHQHGIGCDVSKDKALEMYLLAIEQEKVPTINGTIAKYLLSLFY